MNTKNKPTDFPLVTVITPTYNSNPRFLKETIDSVLEQDYPNIEFIITDDGSENFPMEKIDEYIKEHAKNNISWKIIANPKNLGTIRNMNGALKESHGEYIFDIAHDDLFYDKDVLMDGVLFFQKTGALLTVSPCEYYYENAPADAPRMISPPPNKLKRIDTLTPKDLYADLAVINYINGPCLSMSKKCFEIYGYYDENYRIIEDWPFLLNLLKNKVKFHVWNRITRKYRQGYGVSSGVGYKEPYLTEYMKCQREALHNINGIKKYKVLAMYLPLNYYLHTMKIISSNNKHTRIRVAFAKYMNQLINFALIVYKEKRVLRYKV